MTLALILCLTMFLASNCTAQDFNTDASQFGILSSLWASLNADSTAIRQTPSRSHGRYQLSQILADRPSIRGILPDDDVVTLWVVRKLEFGSTGETVVWDETEPDLGKAEHIPGRLGSPSRVRISNSNIYSGRDKWYMLVFELHNLMHPQTVAQLQHAGRNGELNRSEFVNAIFDYEYERIAWTNRFFTRYPLPDATAQNAPLYTQYLQSKTDYFDRKKRHEIVSEVHTTVYGQKVIDLYQSWYDRLNETRRPYDQK